MLQTWLKQIIETTAPTRQQAVQRMWQSLRIYLQELEHNYPRLSQNLLGIASNWREPFVLGMGCKINASTEDSIVVGLPNRWRNWNEQQKIHSAGIQVLSEFAVRSYWEKYFTPEVQFVGLKDFHWQAFKPVQGDIVAQYRITKSERELTLWRIRMHNHVEISTQILIFNSQEHLLGQVEAQWEFKRELALPESPAKEN